ncbi:MAG: general secretion pathway protein GspD [Rhodocyclales bacterium]|nr:general secretion pathway protein GspD [Rhodocyclales bacterium]
MKIVRVLALAVLLVSGCASNVHFKEGRELLAAGQGEEGLARLEQSVRDFPDDREARAFYYREREKAVAAWAVSAEEARTAGRPGEAESLWRKVQRFEPASPRARDGLTEIAMAKRHKTLLGEAEASLRKNDAAAAELRLRTVLAENPGHAGARDLMARLQEQEAKSRSPAGELKPALNKPITLDFRDTALKTVFEVMSRTAGINFVLDKDVKADTKVTIFVRNAGIEEVLRLIAVTNQLQHRVIGETSVLVYPATLPKQKEYLETVTRSFYLANAEAKQAQLLIKSIVKTRDLFIDEKLNLLVMRDTPDAVRLAERLLAARDLAEPEVMLEIEVLEISRSRLLELGSKFPEQVGYGLLQPNTTTNVTTATGFLSQSTTLGGALSTGMIDLENRAGLTSYITNPGVLLNLKNQVGDGTLLANPRIRVKNREKAKIHIGEKLPIFTTTSTANVGVSASVSYLDVGLKLDVEPSLHLDDEVDIKVGLEVSSIVKEVTGPSNSLAYQVGTRSASTALRLKDGETQILAGLINDEERMSANRLPGLGDLPLVGRLFSSQRDNRSKTEIVLLVTPRVVRNLMRPTLAAPTIPAGTDSAVGTQPLSIKGRSGVSLSSKSGAGLPAQAAAEPGEPPEQAESVEPPAPPPPAPVPAPTGVQSPQAAQ